MRKRPGVLFAGFSIPTTEKKKSTYKVAFQFQMLVARPHSSFFSFLLSLAIMSAGLNSDEAMLEQMGYKQVTSYYPAVNHIASYSTNPTPLLLLVIYRN